MLKSAKTGIVSNFQKLSNSADFSNKQNVNKAKQKISKNKKPCKSGKIVKLITLAFAKTEVSFFWIVFRWLSQCASPRPLHYSLHLQEAGWSSEAASRGTLMLLFKGRLAVSSSARPRPLPRPLRHHVQVWVLRTRPPEKYEMMSAQCSVANIFCTRIKLTSYILMRPFFYLYKICIRS